MAERRLVSLQEAVDILPRRPALLLGPTATVPLGALNHEIEGAVAAAKIPEEIRREFSADMYPVLLDALRAVDPASGDALELDIRARLLRLHPSHDLKHLARAGWAACVSLTQDLNFERALRDYQDSLPSSKTVTLIDHASVQPPQKTIPIYKLLGSLDTTEPGRGIALAASDLALREQEWHLLLKTLPDHIRDAPLFCIGTAGSIELVKKTLATLLAMQKPNITSVMFLKDDATLRDPTVQAIIRRIAHREVDASLKDLCNSVAELKPKQRPLILRYDKDTPQERLLSAFEGAANIVSLVPTSLPPGFDPAAHRNALVDALFRPTSIDWAPYLVGLDLRRDVATRVKDVIRQQLEGPLRDSFNSVVLLGEAGVGKTAVAKRVACDLAAEGIVVLWARRVISGNWSRRWRELVQELSSLLRKPGHKDTRFLVICDDPYDLRIDSAELMTCFERFKGRVTFLVVLRFSDYFTSDGAVALSMPLSAEQQEVPYELVPGEIDGLADVLVRIGGARDKEAALQLIASNPSPNSRDILCSLWYLIPETQAQFAQSLEDQYRRLGAARDSISAYAQQTGAASDVAKRAYEYVTVASGLDLALPMEVLVRALRVDYAEWFESARLGKPLWGLLYDDVSEDESTVVYRTRNEVVTEILLDLVNGGVGHAGEVRVLKDLLRACDGGSPVYRNFVLDLLAKRRNRLSKVVSYQEGLELFQIAQEALPYKDRVLEHHKGLWMAHVGRDYRGAYTQYEKAMDTESYPGAETDSPVEHIHTSMAAAVVQLVKHREQTRESGLEVVRNHLRIANGSMYFQAYTSHVAANLLFEMAKQGGVVQQDDIAFKALGEALEEIERAVQMIGARGRTNVRFAKSMELLETLRREIVGALPDLERMKQAATDIYQQSHSQSGFEAVARAMLSSATHSDKGRAFNAVQEYIAGCDRVVAQADQTLSVELRATRADLLVRWRVQRPSGPIDWRILRQDLDVVLLSAKYRENILKRFYLGVALYHLGEITNANVVFSALRRVMAPSFRPNDIRCYFLGKEGMARRLQCILERSQGRYYATVSELGTDIPVQSPPSDVGPGATTHCFVGFSFKGATAVFQRPDDMEMLLG